MRADLWVLHGEPIEYPPDCPTCGSPVGGRTLDVRDRIDGAIWAAWPHCDRCVLNPSRRKRATSILARFMVAGFVFLGLAIAFQFMETGLADDTLLAIGLMGFLALAGGPAVALALWLTARGGWGSGAGVRFKSLYWEGRERVPLPGLPLFVRYRFRRREYRDAFLSLNPAACDRELEAMKSRCRAETVLSELRTPEEEVEVARQRQHVRDWLSDSWDLSWTFSLIAAVLCGYLAIKVGVAGPNRWPILPLLGVAAAAVGYMLRIELARKVMGGVAILATLAAGAALVREIMGDSRVWTIIKLAGFFAALAWNAWAFQTPSARRLCSRWGRLAQFFARRSAP